MRLTIALVTFIISDVVITVIMIVVFVKVVGHCCVAKLIFVIYSFGLGLLLVVWLLWLWRGHGGLRRCQICRINQRRCNYGGGVMQRSNVAKLTVSHC